MMTHDEVLSAAEADPNGFGWKLRPNSLVPFGEWTDKLCESLPPAWRELVVGGSDDFYASLLSLWRRGCSDGAYAPELVERQLVFASFIRGDESICGIRYIFESFDDADYLFFATGDLPSSENALREYPDYGPLTQFCRLLHSSFDREGDIFIRHPSWKVEVPLLNLVKTMPTWAKFYSEEKEDREEPIEFTEWTIDRTADEEFLPSSHQTVQYGKTNSYNFVEPGHPPRYWSFWNGDGEMQLVNPRPRSKTINPIDDDLSYMLGG
jgi:hypothetical protein